MKSRFVIFVVISILVVAVIYSSSSITLRVLAEPSGPVGCERTGTVKITCCQDHIINRSPANPAGTLVTYCTDCDRGPGDHPISGATNCSERYIKMGLEQPPTPVPPGAVARLQESGGLQGGVLGKVTTLPNLSQSIGPITGGILQTDNNQTFSQMNLTTNDSSNSNNISGLKQSDLTSDMQENTTRTTDVDEEEQDDSESGTTGGGSIEKENDGDNDDNEGDEDEDKDKEASQPQQ